MMIYNKDVPELPKRPTPVSSSTKSSDESPVICDRCGAEMFRMHAVWRCPACRYKTDCCGW